MALLWITRVAQSDIISFITDANEPFANDLEYERRNMFETLAHEMVHLRQYATGQLKQLERKNNVYRFGKLYYNSKILCLINKVLIQTKRYHVITRLPKR